MDYLEEVAIEYARGIVSKKIPIHKVKGSMESKLLLSFWLLCSHLRSINNTTIKIQCLLSIEIQDYVMSFGLVRNQIYNTVQSKVMKQSKGLYPAPLKIIEVSKNSS